MVNFQHFKVVLTIISAYIVIAQVSLDALNKQSYNALEELAGNSTTLLVVAHPDDETMFFGPTIMKLVNANKSLTILCMTNGDAESKGVQREQEFKNVIMALGSGVRLSIIRNSQLPDNMTIDWNIDEVVRLVKNEVEAHDKPIKALITFDAYGISGHRNHKSINLAVKQLKNTLDNPSIHFYVLRSLSIARKYSSFLDSVVTIILSYITTGREVVLATNFDEHTKLRQILQLHYSQMTWYRQMYMMFSRYMFINNLTPLG